MITFLSYFIEVGLELFISIAEGFEFLLELVDVALLGEELL
jgi:hypothetical protein